MRYLIKFFGEPHPESILAPDYVILARVISDMIMGKQKTIEWIVRLD